MSSLSYNDVYRFYKKLDQNRDGHGLMSSNELQWFLDTMEVSSTVDELQFLTEKTSLSFPEFLVFYNNITKDATQGDHNESDSDLLKAFEVFDKNRDGFISNEELEEALSSLGLRDRKENMDVKL
ncbi:probable calcium-binding protein CML44 [Rutidosis leptorrhynchoides]|uniref:probable calcium-binding protein CML44 n=1 Tax=Rutidosis leptorrhynchoides TaxID=125765 RepID=UPI003A99D50D